MLYLILLCAVVSLASAVIAEDKEPAIDVLEEGGEAGTAKAFATVAANDDASLTDSELEDLRSLAA